MRSITRCVKDESMSPHTTFPPRSKITVRLREYCARTTQVHRDSEMVAHAFDHIKPSKRVDRMKQALTISLLIMICDAVLSCAPTSILLINLKTNDLHYCPVGEDSDACIKRLEELGYIRADRLTRAQKASLGLSPP
jgi:hypothetical protein